MITNRFTDTTTIIAILIESEQQDKVLQVAASISPSSTTCIASSYCYVVHNNVAIWNGPLCSNFITSSTLQIRLSAAHTELWYLREAQDTARQACYHSIATLTKFYWSDLTLTACQLEEEGQGNQRLAFARTFSHPLHHWMLYQLYMLQACLCTAVNCLSQWY